MKRPRQKRRPNRRGTISVLAAIMTIVLVGMVAFSVDIGYVLSAKEELQRTADATAMAACWEFAQQLADGAEPTVAAQLARTTAVAYAQMNGVTGRPTEISTNPCNSPYGDVVFGYVADLEYGTGDLQTTYPSLFNAVRVRVRKDASYNSEVPYYFARVFGLSGQELDCEATAAIVRDVRGFRVPSDGGNLGILPLAMDLETWNDLVAGNGEDNWRWNPNTKQLEPGSDGVLEANLYPEDTGSPGNRGTVDIGNPNNSTSDLARQILHGVSPADLAHHGGKLELDACGKLYLNGDTGISAGMKDELTQIIGQPRVIPVFSNVEGPGNNAEYTITRWAGIRIVDVKLCGPMSKKRVTIQPAPMNLDGIIPSDTTGTSDYVYSAVVLVK